MRQHIKFLAVLILILVPSLAYSADDSFVQITSVGVTGNENIASEYILNVVDTKPGMIMSRDMIRSDIEAIYNQGFFSFADAEMRPEGGGVSIMFSVRENPVIESINFTGNSLYTSEQLMHEVLSQEGTTFNRNFFRNDLDRIQEKYHKDGYVMVRVSDVQIDGGNIYVTILEPKVGDVIIQGNTKTKTYVIRREIKIKQGDVFNVTHFRHQLGKLQGLGYFEDVNVAFDVPEDSDGLVDLIITVKEKRTASIGLNLAYGTESGIAGGLTYSDTNVFGRGIKFEIGFNEGDDATYWTSLSSPYMDAKTFGWSLGARYRHYDDRYYYRRGRKQFEYDEKTISVYAGLGKKFSNEDWSWFLTLRHEHADYENMHNAIPGYMDDLTPWDGTNQTVELQLVWDKRDVYSPYSKGFVWDTNLEQAVKVLGGEYSYLKYWTQARLYVSLNQAIAGIADTSGSWTDENPLLFAARVRIGSATEDELPSFARYSLGGMNSLRGYNSRSFEGSNFYLGNFELRIPVSSAFTVVGFYDIGNADTTMDWKNYHDNFGLGIRVKTPFGNLRVDYAKGEDENRTYFGFGEMF
ncbi:MAG: BamA/TamA family outer membrane protein [Synergistaceae bacterium]|nr:BamA/TamA family outer membrane protein [Synergistaceae bacterium]MBQ3448490.1 BamA/TamA family outer membrane protein [Synergistaceae bacterium]MBQ3693667.1 BamA/TamA family outer membrane protein [Synergistaceae bacterium]MBQ9628994.1 BamA/TamA family outer membrane protein [Synergistaceae bacterium]